MKKTALIGASGFVGSAILNELLSRGYNVEALVRNPEKISIENPNLTVKKVDVADEKALAEDLKGYDAVISAYNPGWTNPNIYNDTLQNYPRIVEAVNGVSLTVCDSQSRSFRVAIIPYTLEHTNFHAIAPGTRVNLEFDIIGKYLVRLMQIPANR